MKFFYYCYKLNLIKIKLRVVKFTKKFTYLFSLMIERRFNNNLNPNQCSYINKRIKKSIDMNH